MDKVQLLRDLLNQVDELPSRDSGKLDALLQKTEMIFRRISLPNHYLDKLRGIIFRPLSLNLRGDNTRAFQQAWNSGIVELSNLINVIIEEIEIFGMGDYVSELNNFDKRISNRIFIVHGHSDAIRQAVTRMVEKLGFEPIVLHEQANMGRTIIEKFEEYSDVGFAVILLSADDMGYLKTESPKSAKSRARQNVIFEMGYFIGKLGRDRVLLLLEKGVERPSDIDGVVYTNYDGADGSWRTELFKELKACGYDVDANKLF